MSMTSSAEQLAQADAGPAFDDDEPLDLPEMEVIAAGRAGDGRREEGLAPSAVGLHGLDEAAACVRPLLEPDWSAVEHRRAQGVEQVGVEPAGEGRDLTMPVDLLERPESIEHLDDAVHLAARTLGTWLAIERVDQHLRRVLGVHQLDVVVGDMRFAPLGYVTAEGGDEGVVVGASVLAEQVGQLDVDVVPAVCSGVVVQEVCRAGLAVAVRRAVAGADAVREHHTRSRPRCTDGLHDLGGERDVAIRELVVGAPVHGRQVDHCIGTLDGSRQVVGAPDGHHVVLVQRPQAAPQVPAQETVGSGDGNLHVRVAIRSRNSDKPPSTAFTCSTSSRSVLCEL